MRRISIGLVCAVATATAAGCGQQAPPRAEAPALTEGARGVSAELPPGWQKAPATLTPGLSDPLEVLSVGTFPLAYRQSECAHMPSSAIADMGPLDAFITLQERGTDANSSWQGFPPRPPHFGPGADESMDIECAPSERLDNNWFGFTDGDRHFHVLVSFGKQAPESVRHQAWGILDSLRIDPDIRPDWSSAG